MKKIVFYILCLLLVSKTFAASILIPMDDNQKNHLKAYGIAYFALEKGYAIHWLLNYKGGAFLLPTHQDLEQECKIRGVSYEVFSGAAVAQMMNEIATPEINMEAIKLEKVPRIAVYSPKGKKPWDDAVTLALTYAEIPYDVVYDKEVMEGKLDDYDWLHLHHEDFTGQFGKFYNGYQHMPWYKKGVAENMQMAKLFGFSKVSQLKKAVVLKMREFVRKGGFLFAMCSATDTFDICLAAKDTDICSAPFDGDAMDPQAQQKLNFNNTFAFKDFTIEKNYAIYEYSDIDVTLTRKVPRKSDYFSLFEFSAKWDPVPTMLCQNHKNMIKGFMGQTTAFRKKLIKSGVLILGENKSAGEARYIHGTFGKGTWTFYGGHDPEDYQHLVGDLPTDLSLKKNSAGYRLILNNVLFPAAKKKKRKT